MKTQIKRIGGEWCVTITQGVQTFTLSPSGNYASAKFTKKMLDMAFENFKKDILQNVTV